MGGRAVFTPRALGADVVWITGATAGRERVIRADAVWLPCWEVSMGGALTSPGKQKAQAGMGALRGSALQALGLWW